MALGEAQVKLAANLCNPDPRSRLKESAMEVFRWALPLDPDSARERDTLAQRSAPLIFTIKSSVPS